MPQESVDTRNVVSIGLADGACEPAGVGTSAAKSANEINDNEFIAELNRLRNLKSFLNNEAVFWAMPDADSRTLGDLFTLRPSDKGRSPTGLEWSELDRFNQMFFQRLTEAQRRRFLLGGIPKAVAKIPVIFAAVALAALLVSFLMPHLISYFSSKPGPELKDAVRTAILPFYLLWLVSLGALGSIAFIGMNALSVQQDITFDILNSRLINLRIVLGALFALVFTLPFGFLGYIDFLMSSAFQAADPGKAAPGTDSFSAFDGVKLIMPFLLGFSTSLVITILNRMVEAVQSFFGNALIMTARAPTQVTSAAMSSATDVGSPRRRRQPSRPHADAAAAVTEPPR